MGLQNELTWQQTLEAALEKCGFDMKTSGKSKLLLALSELFTPWTVWWCLSEKPEEGKQED